jgi:hypothetical protein
LGFCFIMSIHVEKYLHHGNLHYEMIRYEHTNPTVEDDQEAAVTEPDCAYELGGLPPEKVHYVDNDEMLAAWMVFQADRKACAEAGKPEPVVPRYIAECILKICHRTAYKHNFINYSFRDEMISDAIENCLRGINTFNPNLSKYIFSYYTTAAWNAFVRRIQREAKESAIKGKIIAEMDIDNLVRQEHDNGEYQTNLVEYMKQAQDYREAHEKRGLVSVEEKPEPQHENAIVFDD